MTESVSLKGKVLFITGASRGIGKAIAFRAAHDGAKIIIAAKTVTEHPKLAGTIFSAQKDIEKAGGVALAVQVDVRSEEQLMAAILKGVDAFGSIDILVNNAGAIDLSPVESLTMKKFDLMHQVNIRGAYLCSQLCLPYLEKSSNPHILNLAPPLSLDKKWYSHHLGYSLSKFGMSLCVLGMSEEFREKGIAVNALWPKTTIATAAISHLLGGDEVFKRSRTPQIVADAAYSIVTKPSKTCSGQFFLDEEVLRADGVEDFSQYLVNPQYESELIPDLFL